MFTVLYFQTMVDHGNGAGELPLGGHEEVTQVLAVLVVGSFSFLHSCSFLIAFVMTYFCSDKGCSEMYRWP